MLNAGQAVTPPGRITLRSWYDDGVVEDESSLRDLLREELTRSGYQVETASNGFEGLDKYGVDL